jgi:hypothetical protein
MLRCRNGVHSDPIEVPLFIRFEHPEITLQRKTRFPKDVSRDCQSTAMICSVEANGFDITRRLSNLDVLCSSTTKVSTLTEITADGFAACITAYGHITEEGSLDSGAATLEVPFVAIEDIDNSEYNVSSQMTLLECTIVKFQRFCIRLQLLTSFDAPQDTTVPTTCPYFVECQNSIVIISATSTMADMGTLSCHDKAQEPFWADVSCHDTIEDSN